MPNRRRALTRKRDAEVIDAENGKQGEKAGGADGVAVALRSNLASSCSIRGAYAGRGIFAAAKGPRPQELWMLARCRRWGQCAGRTGNGSPLQHASEDPGSRGHSRWSWSCHFATEAP